MNDTFTKLYDEFLAYVDKNDEEGAKKFIFDNLQKFPEDVQAKIALAFFEEAVISEAEEEKNIAEVQKQGLNALSQIEKVQKIIEEGKKIETLRSNLDK
jgi:hypothetical protein